MNCFSCKHRGRIPGDTHSCCHHPDIDGSPLGPIMALLGVNDESSARHKLGIIENPHGVKMGWCIWPINFDPSWLENCNGYEEKK